MLGNFFERRYLSERWRGEWHSGGDKEGTRNNMEAPTPAAVSAAAVGILSQRPAGGGHTYGSGASTFFLEEANWI